jgi:predicted anti-sigma-YlaC factor YlaD
MAACETYQGLLMGLLDGELDPEEAQSVNTHLHRCAGCRQAYEQLRQSGKKIEAVSFTEPQDEVLNSLWKQPYSRLTRNASLLLILAGYLVLILFGIYEFIQDRSEAILPKMATVAICVGFLVLLCSVIRERLRSYKTDPYKEIER